MGKGKPNSGMEDPSGESIFFIPFNFFYFFGFTPFRTYYNQDTDKYNLKTNAFQKVMCAMVHIIAAIYEVYFIFNCCSQFKSSSETSVIALFDVVSNFAFFLSFLLVMYHMWKEQESYLQLLESTRCVRKPGNCCSPFGIYSILIACCLFLAVVSWFQVQDSEHYISQTVSFHNRTTTQLENVIGLGNENDFQFYADQVIAWGNTIMYIHLINLYMFVQAVFFVLILALHQLGAEFRTKIEIIKKQNDMDKGIQLYRKLKTTIDQTQKLYGDFVLTFYICSVSYYAEAPHVIMGKRGYTEIAVLIVFAITSLLWIWAAEFHHRVHARIVEWISFSMERSSLSLEDIKLLSIRSEVSSDPIALSCRCFCVTYKHICSMLGVVATYGVIVVQLNRD